MPLKDLVTDRAKLDEDMIEKIIAEHVRYDPARYEIVFTPQGAAQGNEAKILVYLVAVLGWSFVVDDAEPVDTKPATLETVLGIPGGTLRPILKKLKDSHLLENIDGNYGVRIANLDAVENLIKGNGTNTSRRRTANRVKKSARTKDNGETVEAAPAKSKRKGSNNIRAALSKWIKEGFFSEYRTLSEILDRFHERAIITKMTSLSGPVADLVRNEIFDRKKIVAGKKTVWAYKAK